MTTYAQTEVKYARLATEFGEQLARKWFGDDVVDQMPLYVRGKNKGKPKGYLKWKKVIKGGWKKTGPTTTFGYEGQVVYPNQIIEKWIELPEWGEEPKIIRTLVT